MRYYTTDHLGSVRTVLRPDGSTVADNDYYPYGKRINTAAATAPAHEDRHTFSGKEELAMTPAGVPYLDFGARFYSPGTGRWLSIDPMAEKYYGIGTHVYYAGNPVYYLDPDGNNPIVGALVGAGLEVAGQIANNIITGNHWSDIEGNKVLIAAVTGASGVGFVSKVKEVKALVNYGKITINAAEVVFETGVNAAESAMKQYAGKGAVSIKETLIDAGIGAFGSGVGQSVKAIKRTNNAHELKTLARQLDRAERVAAGNHPKPSRQAKVNKIQEELESFGDGMGKASNASVKFFMGVIKSGINSVEDNEQCELQ